jgi:S-adenosylmethionine hydrolase
LRREEMAEKPSKLIALLTDYGYKDPYVGAVKGVILSINPRAVIIDISHEISSYDISEASYVLNSVYKEYPEGTIFVVVIDPGVGSSRRGVLVETRRYYFIGPDNGVLRPAIDEDGIKRVILLNNEKYFRKPVSHTFHGRDIFASVAAYLSLGIDPSEFGETINPNTLIPSPLNIVCEKIDKWVRTFVIHIDRFGNVITGCRTDVLEKLLGHLRSYQEIFIRVRGVETYKGVFHMTFSMAKPGEIVMYPGSMGFIELGVYMSSFARKTNCKKGDELLISRGA